MRFYARWTHIWSATLILCFLAILIIVRNVIFADRSDCHETVIITLRAHLHAHFPLGHFP